MIAAGAEPGLLLVRLDRCLAADLLVIALSGPVVALRRALSRVLQRRRHRWRREAQRGTDECERGRFHGSNPFTHAKTSRGSTGRRARGSGRVEMDATSATAAAALEFTAKPSHIPAIDACSLSGWNNVQKRKIAKRSQFVERFQ